MTNQTNAQRLADAIERYNAGVMSQAIVEDYCNAASELRRLDAENAQLRAELERLQKESEAVSLDAEKHAKYVSSAIQALETDYVLRNAINNALAFLRLIDAADAVKGGAL